MENTTDIHYDAFISYKHLEPDSIIAQKLHHMLEHYHIPKRIQKLTGKKKFSRVFRDREELPLSADLGENIQEALEHSDFLIVICSPESKESQWVQREVATFLEYHDQNQVLTLLVKGEPEDAFPEVLCYKEKVVLEDGEEITIRMQTEPMAADIRGNSLKEMSKKLKQEFLRIAAPMLSCTYDDLRQRHREYRFRQILAASGVVCLLAVCFMAYAFRQASLINERYQEARRNQARYLSEISGELLKSGDRHGALKTALAIVPEDEDSDEPVVPEQMYALNNALYSYQNTDTINFLPDRMVLLDGQSTESGTFSSLGNLYFCLDQTGHAYVLDAQTGDCIQKIAAAELPEMTNSTFTSFRQISDTQLVLFSKNHIINVKSEEDNSLHVITLNDSHSVNYLSAANASIAAIAASGCVAVYDLESGQCILELPYDSDNEGQSYNVNSTELSPSGNLLAVGLGNRFSDEQPTKGLAVVSLTDGTMELLSSEETKKIFFIDDTHLAAIHSRYTVGYDYPSIDNPETLFSIVIYDLTTNQPVWTGPEVTLSSIYIPLDIDLFTAAPDGETEQNVLAVTIKNQLLLLNAETGEVIQTRNYNSDIVGIGQYDSQRLLVGLNDGSIKLSTFGNMTTALSVGQISSDVSYFAYNPEEHMIIQTCSESRSLVFSRIITDEHTQRLPSQNYVSSVNYLTVETEEGDTRTFRCLRNLGLFGGTKPEFSIWEAGTDTELCHITAESESDYLDNISIGYTDGHLILYYTRINYEEQEQEIHIINLESGEELFAKNYYDDLDWHLWQLVRNITYAPSMEQAAVFLENYSDNSGFAFIELTGDSFIFPDIEKALIPQENICSLLYSCDSRYLIVISSESGNNYESSYQLKVWDIEAGDWLLIDGSDTYTDLKKETAVISGKTTPVIAVYSDEDKIDIIDLDSGKITHSIPFVGFESYDFAFIDNDEYLITCGENTYLTLWDIEEEKIMMQDTESFDFGVKLVTDRNNKYFGLKNNWTGYDENVISVQELKIYYIDESHRFYPYADIPGGYASFEAGEILTSSSGNIQRISGFYSYNELRERAEEILDGDTLTESEKRTYFISE